MALSTPPQHSLSGQISVFILCFAVVCVLATGGLLSYLGYSHARNEVERLLATKTDAAATEIEAYVDDLKRKLDYLARVQGLTDLPPLLQQRLLQGLLRHNKAYEIVLISDTAGVPISSAAGPGLQAPGSIETDPVFAQALLTQTDTFGPLDIDPVLQVPILDLALPVRNVQDDVAGVLWARLNLKFLLYVLADIELGQSGYAYLLDNRNFLLAPGSEDDVLFGPVQPTHLPDSFRQMQPTGTGSRIYPGLKEQQVFGAVDTIRSVNGRWRLIVEYPLREVYGPMRNMLWAMAAMMAAALIIGSILALTLSRRLVRPLNILTGAAKDLGRGNLDSRVDYDRDDEIGVLAETFNTMAMSLQSEMDERNRVQQSLMENEGRYRVLFEASPISLWEEDFSLVKKRLDQLRTENNEKLEDYFQSHPDEVAHCADLVRVLDVNAATLELLEAEDKEELMAGLRTVFSPETLDTFHRELLTLARGERSFRSEIVHKTLKGREVQALLHLAVAPGHEETLGKVLVSLLDITERRRAELEKSRLEEQLLQAQKMEALGQLSSGIAHDFNNLLQAISGHVQLLLMQKATDDPDFKHLVEVERSSSRAAELIRRLLTFSRRMEVKLRPVNLNRIVVDTLAMLERTLPKMVRIESRLAEDLAAIQADPTQMEQVLMNLATNAVDAMDQQGTLSIETENFIVDEVYKNKYLELQAGEYVLLKVTDTGPGMDEATRQRIFEPFFTTKAKGRGTGLGLATVFGIVQGHNGYVSCYTTQGVGTTFKIFLPVGLQDHSGMDMEMELPKNLRGGKETILLVDDEAIILDIAQEALQQHGYRTLRASSGEEALRAYDKAGRDVDLVLLDLGMPGMGGEQTLKSLRERDPDLAVIVASGYGAHAIARNPADFGAAAFLSKPYRLDELLLMIRKILDHKALIRK